MKNLRFVALLLLIFALFSACSVDSDDTSSSSSKNDPNNVKPFATKSQNLDFLFSTKTLAEINLSVTRTEWNHLLKYYDWQEKNESYIHADFSFSKTDSSTNQTYTWKKNNVGLKIRGNTSRARPQKEFGANNEYNQAHFKINFEEFLTGNEEWKLANCMKGIILKRFKEDPTYCREVFCYNLFRKNEIWTSPRASYAHLTICIEDSEDSVEEVDFGIFAMIESIDKQFIKERTLKQSGGTFSSNEGNLWKCSYKSGPAKLNSTDGYLFGVEDVRFETVYFDDQNIGTENDQSSYGNFINNQYTYDLKTNKKELSYATSQFSSWIKELNALSNSNASAIKTWYESNFSTELFIKTYAISVLTGMWDDYWGNGNNFYFYFDSDNKAYFIPFDYDNTLGVNWNNTDWATKNPLEWTLNYGQSPLIEKLLKVPEYKEKYQQYLLEFSKEGSYFSPEVATKTIKEYHALIEEKIYSPNLLYETATTSTIEDYSAANWGTPYKDYKLYSTTDSEKNYFAVKQKSITEFVKGNL